MSSIFECYMSVDAEIRFLQLLSSKASQKITYHCKNSIAVFDAAGKTYRNAIKLMTISDTELNARGNSKFRYRLVKDGCKVRFAYFLPNIYFLYILNQ